MLIALCQSTCSCSCQCSTTIMKRMKQATLFGFLVLNMLIILCLSDWFAAHQTLGLQERFVQVNQRVLKQKKILWRLQTQGGWLATQSTPPWISPWYVRYNTLPYPRSQALPAKVDFITCVTSRVDANRHDLIARGHARNPAHIIRARDRDKYTRSFDGTKTTGYTSRKSQGIHSPLILLLVLLYPALNAL